MHSKYWPPHRLHQTGDSSALTDTFKFADFQEQNRDAILLFVVTVDKRLQVITTERPPAPLPGQRLIYLA
ncbi:MAG: hypothetical protein JNK74_20125 [Candidatus Hydrogenedentes bacterium]|nr:hypothetical protein [Candidatus Hydrogenedentota bacterium]